MHILFDFLSHRKQIVVFNGQSSSWTNVHARVLQESILGSLLLSVYIHDLADDLSSNIKLFADDTSLFSVVHDVNASARKINDDLKKIYKWAFQWKISFNPDPSKKTQEVIFIRKIKKLPHPSFVLNNNNVLPTSSQNHLGVTLDVKLTFD